MPKENLNNHQDQSQNEAFFYHPTITGIVFPDYTLIPNKKLCDAMHIDNPTIGTSINIKNYLPLDICEQISNKIKSLTPTNPEIKTEFIVYGLDQQEHIIGSTLAGKFDQKGQLEFAIGTSKDITENKKNEEKLKANALTDSLTGAFNQHYLKQKFEAFSHSRTVNGLTMTILDVDNFKKINDELGHDVGNEILKKLTGVIKSTIRPEEIFARIGGDEFAIILPNLTDPNKVQKFLYRLNKILVENNLHVSFGFATTKNEINYDDIFHEADQNLLYAKQNYKGTF